MGRSFEIEPASVAQVKQTDKGKMVLVDDDVQNVASDLRAIDPGLRVMFDPGQDFFTVYHVVTLDDGSVEEHLVTTSQTCDQRLVARVREISAPGYDYAAELDKVEAQAKADRDREFSEHVGPLAEELRHAMRKDLGVGDRAFIPGGGRG